MERFGNWDRVTDAGGMTATDLILSEKYIKWDGLKEYKENMERGKICSQGKLY